MKKTVDINPESILILRALQLGDTLCAVPAWRALRAAYQDANIALVGLPWAREFVRRFYRYLDEFIEFPGFPGLPERKVQACRIPDFLMRIQERHFDLALQMHGSGQVTNPLISLFAARRTAGFYRTGEYSPDDRYFLLYPDELPEVDRHLRLMEHLGITAQGEELEFPLEEGDWSELQALGASAGLLAGSYICIHPGARAVERRWPAEWFAELADGLSGLGLQIVLTGTEQETAIVDTVLRHMHSPAINLAGKTSLGGLAALLSQARLLISNDTGVSHLADAVRIPSVVLFTASNPSRWAPKNRDLHRVIPWAAAALPDVVIPEARALLEEAAAHAV
jgi:ADP-heptose:LPS heptosyltransferase